MKKSKKIKIMVNVQSFSLLFYFIFGEYLSFLQSEVVGWIFLGSLIWATILVNGRLVSLLTEK